MMIDVFADASGSMNELGKRALVRNLFRFLRDYQSFSSQEQEELRFSFSLWSDTVEPLLLREGADIGLFRASGKADFSALEDFLISACDEKEHLAVIVIGDGNYSKEKIQHFHKALKKRKLSIRTICVGSDANHARLKMLSTDKKTYAPWNISVAIDSLLYETPVKTDRPRTCSGLME